jgi:O-acetylserine/cysteine efflux transporter
MPVTHIGLVLAISLVWGLNFAVAKFALVELPPFLLTGIRFALLIAILFPFIKRHEGQMKLVLAVGLTGGALNFGFFFLGLKYATASSAAVFVQLNAPFAVLLSIVFLGEHFNRHYQVGLALAFGGVMLLSFDPSVFAYIGGLVAITLCALMVAVSNVLMKKLKNVGVMDLQVWIAIVSCPTILIASLIFETGQIEAIRNSSWVPWAAIVFMALGANLIGHGGVYYLLQRHDVSRISTMLLLAPCIGILSGVFLLGEPMTLRIAFGALVTLMGVSVIALRPSIAPIEATPEVGIETANPVRFGQDSVPPNPETLPPQSPRPTNEERK